MKMRLFSTACLVLVFTLQNVQAKKKHSGLGIQTKAFDKSYAIPNADFYVELDNKYGDVTVVPWDKDSIKIHTDVIVRSEKQDKIHDILESIKVDFHKTNGFLLIQTGWDENASFFRKTTYDISKGLSGNEKVEINHIIQLPARLALEIKNRFGNVFMSDHSGELQVDISHGEFRARVLNDVEDLSVRYGRVKVKEIVKGRASFSSVSSVDIAKIGQLDIQSNSSEIEIDKVNTLRIQSKHDEINIEQVASISGKSTLSDIDVELLTSELDITSKLGSIHLQDTDRSASKVRMQGNKTEISIGMPADFAAHFDINADLKCAFRYSERIEYSSKGVNEESIQYLRGYIGSDAKTKITVRAEGGYVDIGIQ